MLKKIAGALALAISLLMLGFVPGSAMAASGAVDPVLPYHQMTPPPVFKSTAKQPAATAGQTRAISQHRLPPKPGGMHPMTTCTTGGGVCYGYVVGAANTPPSGVTGAANAMDVEAPTLSWTTGEFHTLQELSVQSTDQQQTVEIGWNIDHGLYGDTLPHLFVFHWVNGVPKGYNNTSGSGFTQCTTAVCGTGFYTAGQSINSDLGTLKQFTIQYTPGGWWTAYNGHWVGFFADSEWSSASPPVTFTTPGFVEEFGELASNKTIGTSCSSMGDGTKGSAGATGSPVPARIASLTWAGSSTAPTVALSWTSGQSLYDGSMLTSGGVTSTRSFYEGGLQTACAH
jgi:hypothetical protein